ncbi:MAG TPA: fatty acid desaturase [Vicinamibacteria bacterium]|nr:fatty acid desaturase [Vicinamibacteria bacterium]
MAKSSHAEAERERRIRRWIREGEARLVSRHPVLAQRDALGFSLFAASAAGMVGLGWLYAVGAVPGVLVIVGNAFLASILHEIEHDLIHFLYFRTRPLVHNLMMFGVWVLRGNVVHGWYRRGIHLHHHRASGSDTDVEERLLGLGQAHGPRRILVMADGAMAFLLNARLLEKEIPGFRRSSLAIASFPVYPVFAAVLVSYVLCRVLGVEAPAAIDVLAVAWVFPNYLRQASLQIVSSNVHYYESSGTVRDETQVLRPFFLWPLQAFCFNFGTTHSFHHYVVEQPFFIRQLIAPWVLPALARYGHRFNDTGTFLRANRLPSARAAQRFAT